MDNHSYTPLMKANYLNYSTLSKPFKTKVQVLDYYYIHLQAHGYCKVLLEGEMTTVGPGDLLVYEPNSQFFMQVDPVHLRSNGHDISCELYNFGCSGDRIEQWWNSSRPPKKIKIPMNTNLLSIFKTLVLERREKQADQESALKNEVYDHLLQTLFIYIDRAIQQSTSNNLNIDAYLMKDYIERNATEAIKLEDVARHVGLSVSRTVHLFKVAFGKTIMQYALEVRLSMACERIKFSTMTLEQVADSCGFGSYSYFHRAFRSKYRISPKDYRGM